MVGQDIVAAVEPLAPRRAGSAGARLLATQMAVSGSDRREIEERLRGGFDIEDTSEILDATVMRKAALEAFYAAQIARAKADGTYMRLVKKYFRVAPRYLPEFFRDLPPAR